MTLFLFSFHLAFFWHWKLSIQQPRNCSNPRSIITGNRRIYFFMLKIDINTLKNIEMVWSQTFYDNCQIFTIFWLIWPYRLIGSPPEVWTPLKSICSTFQLIWSKTKYFFCTKWKRFSHFSFYIRVFQSKPIPSILLKFF